MFEVEIVYALSSQVWQKSLTVKSRATVLEVLLASHFFYDFPELSSKPLSVGIWYKRCTLCHHVAPGDRVEIYRPLLIDPKMARRKRTQTS